MVARIAQSKALPRGDCVQGDGLAAREKWGDGEPPLPRRPWVLAFRRVGTGVMLPRSSTSDGGVVPSRVLIQRDTTSPEPVPPDSAPSPTPVIGGTEPSVLCSPGRHPYRRRRKKETACKA